MTHRMINLKVVFPKYINVYIDKTLKDYKS